MARRDKENYYLDIAQTVSERSTCLRRRYGAILVTNDEIVSTGYNGAPRGRMNCVDIGECVREKLGVERGQRYELCRAVHAEANAIISAERSKMIGSTLYLVGVEAATDKLVPDGEPCSMCKRLIINAGIEKVVVRNTAESYTVIDVREWIDNDKSIEGAAGY